MPSAKDLEGCYYLDSCVCTQGCVTIEARDDDTFTMNNFVCAGPVPLCGPEEYRRTGAATFHTDEDLCGNAADLSFSTSPCTCFVITGCPICAVRCGGGGSSGAGKYPAPAPARETMTAPRPQKMGAYSDTRESERGTSWQRGSITENLSVSLVRNETEMKSVRTIMRVTDPHNLGYGRDVKELEDYIDLEVVHAWKIEKPLKKAIYETKKVQVRNDMDAMRKAGVSLRPTYTALDNCGLPQLDEGVNERRLLTGTKPEFVHAILQNGIDPRFCSGLFGQGAYLAENPSKVDQYCTADWDDISELQEILYANNGLRHPGKVFWARALGQN